MNISIDEESDWKYLPAISIYEVKETSKPQDRNCHKRDAPADDWGSPAHITAIVLYNP
jgi:hypothetical protein